jgi:hypothetical protein
MSRKNSNNKKWLIITIFGVILVGVIIVAVAILSSRDQDTFEYEGWIDCQPILSPEEEDLCRRAEAANYPYIAY